MAVDASVGEKTGDMQLSAGVAGREHGGAVRLVFKEASVGNGVGDARQVLIYHAACADIGMPDLAVAHLPLRKTHGQTGRLELRVRALRPKTIQIGSVGAGNAVGLAGGSQAEAVHDQENGRFFAHVRQPSRMMAAKSPSLREAPPIRPPSMSGWARRPAQFFAFIDPP